MRFVLIAAVSDGKFRWQKWRGFFDGTETVDELASRACSPEFPWFLMGRFIPEAEYTREKEREVLDELYKRFRSGKGSWVRKL
jgi:hypothetical protein